MTEFENYFSVTYRQCLMEEFASFTVSLVGRVGLTAQKSAGSVLCLD